MGLNPCSNGIDLDQIKQNKIKNEKRLNPCSNGIDLDQNTKTKMQTEDVVLILVLME